MEDLTTQIGPLATTLVALVAGFVQQLKRIPAMEQWQKTFPIYQVASYALGIGGAYMLGIANPVFAGILVGLASGGAYDVVKNIASEKPGKK